MKAKPHPANTRKPEVFKDLNQSKQRVKFEESSIEKQTSKESWSKLVNSDFEILNELKSPGSKVKQVDSKDLQIILNQMKELKEENLILKKRLAKKDQKDGKEHRSESKIKKSKNIEGKGIKKYCKVCIQLLSKGFTTRFCPTHGHSFKLQNSLNLI